MCRSPGRFCQSRKVSQVACLNVCVDFGDEGVELSGFRIGDHLAVPFVIFPAVREHQKLSVPNRELVDGGFDFLNGLSAAGSIAF